MRTPLKLNVLIAFLPGMIAQKDLVCRLSTVPFVQSAQKHKQPLTIKRRSLHVPQHHSLKMTGMQPRLQSPDLVCSIHVTSSTPLLQQPCGRERQHIALQQPLLPPLSASRTPSELRCKPLRAAIAHTRPALGLRPRSVRAAMAHLGALIRLSAGPQGAVRQPWR